MPESDVGDVKEKKVKREFLCKGCGTMGPANKGRCSKCCSEKLKPVGVLEGPLTDKSEKNCTENPPAV